MPRGRLTDHAPSYATSRTRLTWRSALLFACLAAGGSFAATQPIVVELESRAPSARSEGPVAVQPMAGFGPGWGGDAQLFWRAGEPAGDGPRLTTWFEIAIAGSYELTLIHTVAPDFGRFTVFVDGRASSDVDGYAPEVGLGPSRLGRFELARGRHELAFRITGKNPASAGHFVGLDRLELVAAETPRRLESLPKTPGAAADDPEAWRLQSLAAAAGPAPTVAIAGYLPMRPYAEDYLCWLVATRDGPPLIGSLPPRPAWREGDARFICQQSSGSLLEDFGDFMVESVAQLVTSAGNVVDGVSAAYAKVKAGVVDTVAAAFAEIGCGEPCRLAVQLAVDAALATAGVPPSVPNFDALVADLEEQGIDAMTQVVSEAAVSQGVPGPLAEAAAKKAITEMVAGAKKAAATAVSSTGGSSDPSSYWKADPARVYRPGFLLLELANPGRTPTAEVFVGLTQLEPSKQVIEAPTWGMFGSTPVVATETLELGGYRPVFRRIPPLAPGTRLRVELPLTPIADPHRWLRLWHEEPRRLEEAMNSACGAHMPQVGTEAYKSWGACREKFGLVTTKVRYAALPLNEAFRSVYDADRQRFELRLLPDKARFVVETANGRASLR